MMRWSQAFISTLREDPKSAESASHRLLVRAGYIQQIGSGIYSLLPLAVRVRAKIMHIIREEMDAIGAQECLLPALSPLEYWQQSGRLETAGDIMFRLKDRNNKDFVLGVTHEEIFTSIASRQLNSYKQLPQIWYQFQTKFRDEIRPRGGLLRVREFTMKDSYSFDLTDEGLDNSYVSHRDAYKRIFKRLGLDDVVIAEANSGIMGGAGSAEFLLPTDAGEDKIVSCESCSYRANLEKATGVLDEVDDGVEAGALEKFATPSIRTIKELENFEGGTDAKRQIKTLVYKRGSDFFIILLRGDLELNLALLEETLEVTGIEPAEDEEIFELMGAHAGSLGAVNLKAKVKKVVADCALKGRFNMQTGSNEDDFHLRNVSLERDIKVDQFADLHLVKDGESCGMCGGKLSVLSALEVGHIFKLGTKYSEAFNASALDENSRKISIKMGSYGIGIERLMAAIVEKNHNDTGMCWPLSVSPYQILITLIDAKNESMSNVAFEIYENLKDSGFEVLLDDRDVRAGVKFNDGDLIGIPVRITVGRKVESCEVEILDRRIDEKKTVKLSELTESIETLTKRGV